MKHLGKKQIAELIGRNIIFKGTTIFEEYDDESLWDAIRRVHISQARRGDIIINAEEKGDSIVLLLKGEVGVYVAGENGTEIAVAKVKENDFFGEMAIIDETVRMASVRALSDCVLGTILNSDFWEYFYGYKVLAKNILKGLNKRLRETNDNYIQKLAREKEDLIRFNRELERKVKEKTDEVRQKDLQLIEMDRIAGIGTLAAGIAHEINNPLGFVRSSTVSLKKGMDELIDAVGYWDDKPVSEPLVKDYQGYLGQLNIDRLTGAIDAKFDRIHRGIERIAKIVNSLKNFSRLDMELVGKIDINQSIESAVEILSTQDTKNVEFIREFGQVPLIECSSNEINRCLLNVLKNAIDAVESHGIIKLSTSYDEKKDRIVIEIVDNGHGMSPEVARQVFNPFFTTKPVGSGTGIGLSLTERIIKEHGGTIDISSKDGEGTTVTMILPVVGEGGQGAA